MKIGVGNQGDKVGKMHPFAKKSEKRWEKGEEMAEGSPEQIKESYPWQLSVAPLQVVIFRPHIDTNQDRAKQTHGTVPNPLLSNRELARAS